MGEIEGKILVSPYNNPDRHTHSIQHPIFNTFSNCEMHHVIQYLHCRVSIRATYVFSYYWKTKQIGTAPPGFDSGWFISVAFALYDLQHQLITGTYSSLITSMVIALLMLLLTSGNILISIYAIVTISFTIADTIAIFVLLGWDLNILESIVIIMSVGLSVDFSCHYGVAYINSDHDFEYDNSLCCNPDETMFELDPTTNTMVRASMSTINASKMSSYSSGKNKRFSFFRYFRPRLSIRVVK